MVCISESHVNGNGVDGVGGQSGQRYELKQKPGPVEVPGPNCFILTYKYTLLLDLARHQDPLRRVFGV